MSRPLRIAYPNAWYHVMNRGRRAEDIYLDKFDYKSFKCVRILRRGVQGFVHLQKREFQ
jgi:hypothetical protein